MGLREDYFRVKAIVESPKNGPQHRPALRRIIDLYEAKWLSRIKTNVSLVRVSANALRAIIRQA
jgi:hypothetical protein